MAALKSGKVGKVPTGSDLGFVVGRIVALLRCEPTSVKTEIAVWRPNLIRTSRRMQGTGIMKLSRCKFQIRNSIVPRQLVPHTMWRMTNFDAVAFIVRSNAGRQARWRAKRDAEIDALRAAIIKAELARAQAENHLLRQRVLDLEKALVRRESAAKSAQTKAASEVARLKEKNKELQLKLRHMWDWHNNEITKAGGLTFKASSLIAKALHPDATPSEEVRLEAFKAFSAWKGDRDAARRR